MKIKFISLAMLAGALLLSSCGTTGSGLLNAGANTTPAKGENTETAVESSTDTSDKGSSFFGGLLNAFTGNSAKLSQKNLEGTWNFNGTDCVFKSENLLAKAGGAVAAKKIEEKLNTQLSKIGIKEGSSTLTFNADNTFVIKAGSRNINGRYELDATNKTVKLSYLGGLATMTPRISMKNGQISLLFESTKILGIVKGLSALSGSNTAKMIGSMVNNYEGMYVGLEYKK